MTDDSTLVSTEIKLNSHFVGLVILHRIDVYKALGIHYDTPDLRQLLNLYLVRRHEEMESYQRAAVYTYAMRTLRYKIKACYNLAQKSNLEDKRLILSQAENYYATLNRVHSKFQQVVNGC